MIIHPYKLGSRSANRIKAALNTSIGRRVVSVLQRKPKGNRCLIINWGGSEISYPEGQNWIINAPKDVLAMSDKVRFFERVGHDKNFLEWTTDRSVASEWPDGAIQTEAPAEEGAQSDRPPGVERR